MILCECACFLPFFPVNAPLVGNARLRHSARACDRRALRCAAQALSFFLGYIALALAFRAQLSGDDAKRNCKRSAVGRSGLRRPRAVTHGLCTGLRWAM